MNRRFAAGIAFCVALPTMLNAGRQSRLLPGELEKYLIESARLTADERTALLAGKPVAKLLDSDPAKEVAVLGAIWISAPAADYVTVLNDIEHFESGGAFHLTKRISDPPQLEDFAGLELSDDDVKDLRACRVGDCEVKLGEDALRELRAGIRWGTSFARDDASTVLRRLAFEYVTRYREGGNAELAVYRDKEHPTFVANEFRSMIDRLPVLASAFPDLKTYLLEYPRASLPNSTSFLYWQETEFGLKPTIRISHVVVQQRGDRTVVASKMLYSSHYFWTALEVRVLVPDPARGRGFWFVSVSRSRADGLSGFVGSILRGRVRDEVQRGTLTGLTATKRLLEGRR